MSHEWPRRRPSELAAHGHSQLDVVTSPGRTWSWRFHTHYQVRCYKTRSVGKLPFDNENALFNWCMLNCSGGYKPKCYYELLDKLQSWFYWHDMLLRMLYFHITPGALPENWHICKVLHRTHQVISYYRDLPSTGNPLFLYIKGNMLWMREVEQYWPVWILPPYTYLEFIMLTACFFSAHAYLSCGRCRMWHWCEFLGEFGTLNKEAVSHIPGTYGLRCHNSNRHEVLRGAADCQLAGYVDLAYIWGKKW